MVKNKWQPFSNQKGGQKRETIFQFKEFLKNKAGGDDIGLINYYLNNSNEGKKITSKISPQNRLISSYEKLLKIIGDLYNNSPNHLKKKWSSLVASDFTRNDLINNGWNISSKSFTTGKKWASSNGPGAEVIIIPPNSKENEEIENLKKNLLKFWYKDSISKEASNRIIKYKKKTIPVRYRLFSVRTSFQKFRLDLDFKDINISESYFIRLIPKEIKSPRKWSDLCGICEEGKKISKSINSSHSKCKDQCSLDMSCCGSNQEELSNNYNKYKTYLWHFNMQKKIREIYKSQVILLLIFIFLFNIL